MSDGLMIRYSSFILSSPSGVDNYDLIGSLLTFFLTVKGPGGLLKISQSVTYWVWLDVSVALDFDPPRFERSFPFLDWIGFLSSSSWQLTVAPPCLSVAFVTERRQPWPAQLSSCLSITLCSTYLLDLCPSLQHLNRTPFLLDRSLMPASLYTPSSINWELNSIFLVFSSSRRALVHDLRFVFCSVSGYILACHYMGDT